MVIAHQVTGGRSMALRPLRIFLIGGITMNKTLLAVAVALAYSVTPAWADQSRGGGSDPSLTVDVTVDNVANDNSNNSDNRNQSDNSNNSDNSAKSLGLGSTAAASGGQAQSNFNNAFNTSKAIAKVELQGSVSGN
jgi:hypothetical protein